MLLRDSYSGVNHKKGGRKSPRVARARAGLPVESTDTGESAERKPVRPRFRGHEFPSNPSVRANGDLPISRIYDRFPVRSAPMPWERVGPILGLTTSRKRSVNQTAAASTDTFNRNCACDYVD